MPKHGIDRQTAEKKQLLPQPVLSQHLSQSIWHINLRQAKGTEATNWTTMRPSKNVGRQQLQQRKDKTNIDRLR